MPYYRRSYDKFSRYPSTLALIDTKTEKIIRMFDTGPIPKYVTTSPDGRWLAVTHWGDNTIGLIKTVGKLSQYRYDKLITIDENSSLTMLTVKIATIIAAFVCVVPYSVKTIAICTWPEWVVAVSRSLM